MSNFMLVRHKVRDFSEWKRGYDAHLPERKEAGLAEKRLFHDAKDPNEVIVLFEARDLDRAKSFADSANLKDTMKKSGVVDKPEIHFLRE